VRRYMGSESRIDTRNRKNKAIALCIFVPPDLKKITFLVENSITISMINSRLR